MASLSERQRRHGRLVQSDKWKRARFYYAWRGLLFLFGFLLVVGATIPGWAFTAGITSVFSGLFLVVSFCIAYWFSKPVWLAAFVRPERDRSVRSVQFFGLFCAAAYAAESWNYLDPTLARLVIALSGGGFFLVLMVGAARALVNPTVGLHMLTLAQTAKAVDVESDKRPAIQPPDK